MSMLSSLSHQSPIALVSAKFPRGLFFSSAWDRATNSSCASPQFPIAQPSALNTKAVQIMGSLHLNKGLNRLRRIWKGTHDHLLGLAMWLYDIPVYSLSKSYHTTEIPDPSYLFRSLRPEVVASCIIYHRLRNWNYSQSTGKSVIKRTVIGQEELHSFLASRYARTLLVQALSKQGSNRPLSDELKYNNSNLEVVLGLVASSRLYLVMRTHPRDSSNRAFVEKWKNIRDVYFDFTVNDC
jgi:hypothetical protein